MMFGSAKRPVTTRRGLTFGERNHRRRVVDDEGRLDDAGADVFLIEQIAELAVAHGGQALGIEPFCKEELHHAGGARRPDASGAHGRAFDADRPGVHAAPRRGATRAGAADRSGDRRPPGLRADLRHAECAGAFVGVRGHVPDLRADGAVLPAADFAFQTGETRAGSAGGSGVKPNAGQFSRMVREIFTRLG